MKNIIKIGAFFSLLIFYPVVQAVQPGFDCAKASQAVEHAICDSDSLATQDLRLSKIYSNIMDNADDKVKKQVKTDQRQWLKKRNKDCNFSSSKMQQCLLTLYRERNAELSRLLAFDSSDMASGEELKLLRITPKGNDVEAGQQLVFQFDRPVVPIGRMERDAKDIPVSITPALNCEWRWLNTSALACQLRKEDTMKQATRYDVVFNPGLRSEKGAILKNRVDHSFTTARPKVTYSRFVNWLTPGTPLIQVTFNQPVTRTSVEQSLYMQKGSSSRSAVNLIAYPDNIPRQLPWWMALTDDSKQPMVNDLLTQVGEDEARKVWVVEPRQELALDENIRLQVKPGLVSSEGLETGAEERQIVNFHTYPEFEFVGMRCTLKGDGRSSVIPIYRLRKNDPDDFFLNRCAPLKRVSLVFTSPVLSSMVKQSVDFSPRLDGGRKDYDPWDNTRDWSRLSSPHYSDRHYEVHLPELLKAYQEYEVNIDLGNFKDEFGRSLEDKIEFTFYTDHREPKLRLNYNTAILEKDVETDVALYVTNLDDITFNYDRLGESNTDTGLKTKINVEEAEDIAYSIPLGTRKLLGDGTGVLYGSLNPDPEPPNWYRDPEIFAQVTPYQVHFKVGHFNSLAWVSRFDSDEPVAGAKVSLLTGSYNKLSTLKELDISTITDKQGLAELPGLSEIDPELKFIHGGNNYSRRPGFLVKIEHQGDMALVPLTNAFSVSNSNAYPGLQRKGGHTHSWGTTAQGVYKLGDTVEFKIYVRDQSNKNWISPKKEGYELKIYDPQDKVVFENNEVVLNKFGAINGEFKVPEQGAVGWYRFKLMPVKNPKDRNYRFTWTPMSVLVSDFTPSPFKVKTEINGELFKANDQIEITSLATMHSGGPFTEAEVRLTARLQQKAFTTNNPLAKGFTFGSSSGVELSNTQKRLLDIRGSLDDQGQYEDSFKLPETDIYFGSILVESAVKDERGKFVAASVSAEYAGRSRFVGIRNTKWLYEQNKPARLGSLVVNQSGELLADVDISVSIQHRETRASRVKGPGNAYLTQNIMQWVEESNCTIKSAKEVSYCEFKPQKPGYYQFVASIKDEASREHRTTIHGWVTGRGHVVWDQTDDATLQIIAEQADYKIGDTARYLIKNPFPGAKALVSVERYGILDSWIETLETGTPVIEVPIKADYLPGFYLSVVVVSPRVDKPLGAGNVDLGKPSYRMGYVTAKVSDPYKQLKISVSTDKDTYKPRDRVTALIQLDKHNLSASEAVEIAVAVVDESVLALNRKGDSYYDPYDGFNRLDSLDVKNYSLISRLIGRQKFEKKGANPGGGGGSSFTQLRNLFKFVSYWNPSIMPDAEGKAQIEFDVPDNLTGWRILAFAVTENDKMGLGDVNYKVNRPTEVRPVMPNQVIEGDQFKAGFNVMNRTGESRKLKVRIQVDGPLAEASEKSFSYDIDIAPYKRKNFWLPMLTKGYGDLKFLVSAGDKLDTDALEHTMPVNKRRSLETAANYGTITSSHVSESIKIPHGIYTDVGSIGVTLSPSVIGNVDGAVDYLNGYGHVCWEQRLSRAVGASSYVELKEYLDEKTTWDKPEEEVRAVLGAASNFQAPNGGMTYWVSSNKYVSPYLSAYTAMAFNWLRQSGHSIPARVEERLHDYLLKLLRRDDFPSFYSKGMSSSVRAVALAALSESGKINKSDVQRYQSHVAEMDLFGKSHFLQAAIKTANVPDRTVSQTLDSILGHASQSGGKFQFNEAWDDSYKYLLATPLRSNCSILSSLVSAQRESDKGASIGDIPFKLVRSITQSRGNRNHWENTQENVFCLNALIDYSNLYESDDPTMRVSVSVDQQSIGEAAFNSKADAMVTLDRPLEDGDPGRSTSIEIDKQGAGRLYYSARLAYDLKQDNAARINSGIEIRREYSVEKNDKFVLLNSPMDIKRGELVKVDLFVSVPTARHFVAVNDPIPGGLEPVNTNLATASQIDADKANFKAAEESWFYNISDWSYYGRYFSSFYHKELRHDSARFYADYLPAGNYHLSYAAQAIAEGSFSVMPVHVEEMYDPDVYGKGLPATLNVSE